MPISRARTVLVVMQKKKKPAPPPEGGGGELLAVQEPTQGEPIPVVSLFGWQVPLCSRFTWELVQRVKA